MNITYRIIDNGLYGELDALSSTEVTDHLRNYLGNFLLDAVTGTAYANRLNRTPPEEVGPRIRAWFGYLIRKLVHLQPFHSEIRRIAEQMTGAADPLLPILEKIQIPPRISQKITNLCTQNDIHLRHTILSKIYLQYPYSPALIDLLLLTDLERNIPVGQDWLDLAKVPAPLQPLLQAQILQYAVIQGDYQRAASIAENIWPQIEHNEVVLNFVSEAYVRLGDRQKALMALEKSIALDPLQIPMQCRMQQIRDGFTEDKSVLEKNIAIFLYSYNKSELLQKTLRSLAQSHLGNARISVLLNHCTDDSAAAVRAINERYFANAIKVIALPTNIGAPAARNWLLTTEAAERADYVAFLDDDVEIPPHWLTTLLTVLSRTPKAAVAGAKILAPGTPKRIQYLYRNIAVAREDLLRISLDTPTWNYDAGFYDFIRPTTNVMGCCHVLTREAIQTVPSFDIRFSPSQMDDIAHDIDLCLHGFTVMYCGLVECIHYQMSGVGRQTSHDMTKIGNVRGNDVKFFYRFLPHQQALQTMNNLHLVPELPPQHAQRS
ncbi:MAG: hypothetical protein PWQ64_901 [Desulfomicrobiaceae bacterium]|jgi:GT2 family glycosyltransferase|nr:hypothetical protein [Desulfomicrobiaceae bacterium]